MLILFPRNIAKKPLKTEIEREMLKMERKRNIMKSKDMKMSNPCLQEKNIPKFLVLRNGEKVRTVIMCNILWSPSICINYTTDDGAK